MSHVERMYDSGKIDAAGGSAPTLTTGLRHLPALTGRSPGHMMPWAGARLRAVHVRMLATRPPGGGRW